MTISLLKNKSNINISLPIIELNGSLVFDFKEKADNEIILSNKILINESGKLILKKANLEYNQLKNNGTIVLHDSSLKIDQIYEAGFNSNTIFIGNSSIKAKSFDLEGITHSDQGIALSNGSERCFWGRFKVNGAIEFTSKNACSNAICYHNFMSLFKKMEKTNNQLKKSSIFDESSIYSISDKEDKLILDASINEFIFCDNIKLDKKLIINLKSFENRAEITANGIEIKIENNITNNKLIYSNDYINIDGYDLLNSDGGQIGALNQVKISLKNQMKNDGKISRIFSQKNDVFVNAINGITNSYGTNKNENNLESIINIIDYAKAYPSIFSIDQDGSISLRPPLKELNVWNKSRIISTMDFDKEKDIKFMISPDALLYALSLISYQKLGTFDADPATFLSLLWASSEKKAQNQILSKDVALKDLTPSLVWDIVNEKGYPLLIIPKESNQMNENIYSNGHIHISSHRITLNEILISSFGDVDFESKKFNEKGSRFNCPSSVTIKSPSIIHRSSKCRKYSFLSYTDSIKDISFVHAKTFNEIGNVYGEGVHVCVDTYNHSDGSLTFTPTVLNYKLRSSTHNEYYNSMKERAISSQIEAKEANFHGETNLFGTKGKINEFNKYSKMTLGGHVLTDRYFGRSRKDGIFRTTTVDIWGKHQHICKTEIEGNFFNDKGEGSLNLRSSSMKFLKTVIKNDINQETTTLRHEDHSSSETSGITFPFFKNLKPELYDSLKTLMDDNESSFAEKTLTYMQGYKSLLGIVKDAALFNLEGWSYTPEFLQNLASKAISFSIGTTIEEESKYATQIVANEMKGNELYINNENTKINGYVDYSNVNITTKNLKVEPQIECSFYKNETENMSMTFNPLRAIKNHANILPSLSINLSNHNKDECHVYSSIINAKDALINAENMSVKQSQIKADNLEINVLKDMIVESIQDEVHEYHDHTSINISLGILGLFIKDSNSPIVENKITSAMDKIKNIPLSTFLTDNGNKYNKNFRNKSVVAGNEKFKLNVGGKLINRESEIGLNKNGKIVFEGVNASEIINESIQDINVEENSSLVIPIAESFALVDAFNEIKSIQPHFFNYLKKKNKLSDRDVAKILNDPILAKYLEGVVEDLQAFTEIEKEFKTKLEQAIQMSKNNQLNKNDENKSKINNEEQSQTNNEEQSKTNNEEQSKTNNEEQSQTNNEEQSKTNNEEQSQTNNGEQSKTNNEEQSQTNNEEQSQTNNEEQSKTNNGEQSKTNNEEQSQTNNGEQSKTNNEEQSQTNNKEQSQANNEEQSQTNNEDKGNNQKYSFPNDILKLIDDIANQISKFKENVQPIMKESLHILFEELTKCIDSVYKQKQEFQEKCPKTYDIIVGGIETYSKTSGFIEHLRAANRGFQIGFRLCPYLAAKPICGAIGASILVCGEDLVSDWTAKGIDKMVVKGKKLADIAAYNEEERERYHRSVDRLAESYFYSVTALGLINQKKAASFVKTKSYLSKSKDAKSSISLYKQNSFGTESNQKIKKPNQGGGEKSAIEKPTTVETHKDNRKEKSATEKEKTVQNNKTAEKEISKKGTEERKTKFSINLPTDKLPTGKLPTGKIQTGVLKKYSKNKATEKSTIEKPPPPTKTAEKSSIEKPTTKTAEKEISKKGTEERKTKFSINLPTGKLPTGKLQTGKIQTGVLKKYSKNKATEKSTIEKPPPTTKTAEKSTIEKPATTTKPNKTSQETHEPKPSPTSQSSKTNAKSTTTTKKSDHPQNLSVLRTYAKSDKNPLHAHFKSDVFDREVSFAARRSGIFYRVYLRNDIDWNRVRTSKRPESFCGKTNLEAALSGIAPELADGSTVNLHHVNQNAFEPLVEVSSSIHNKSNKQAFRALHNQFEGQKHPEFPVDRSVFNADRVNKNDINSFLLSSSKYIRLKPFNKDGDNDSNLL